MTPQHSTSAGAHTPIARRAHSMSQAATWYVPLMELIAVQSDISGRRFAMLDLFPAKPSRFSFFAANSREEK